MGVWPRYRYRRPTPGRRAQRAGPGLDHRPLPQGVAHSPALRRADPVTSAVLLAFAASNLVACFFLQGFAWQMPGDPTGYALFH
ncbi:hypothetical protein [Streptomyces sp. R33]|uniref:Uncharacterized protein n=1 Tax=Streptomyces sp. R33 TaxID=3238629 RepID=A0AB39Y8I9_9ACTN